MKNVWKKAAAVLLAAVMAMGILPITALASAVDEPNYLCLTAQGGLVNVQLKKRFSPYTVSLEYSTDK